MNDITRSCYRCFKARRLGGMFKNVSMLELPRVRLDLLSGGEGGGGRAV